MSQAQDHPPARRPFSRRASGQPPTVADSERLMAGRAIHPEAPALQHALAGLLDYAAGPGSAQELAGEAAAVAAFRLVVSERRARSARPRAFARPGRVIGAGLAAAAVVAFSGAAAADELPAPVQELAHTTFGAPAPSHAAPGPAGTSPALSPSARPDPTASPGPTPTPHGKAKGTGKATPTPAAPTHGTPDPNGKAKGKATPPGHQNPTPKGLARC
jgi:hypothetical protein